VRPCHKEGDPLADAREASFKPPYMAFQTFWNFVDEMSSHPLPPVIDRSLMGTKSGTDQANLLSTLKAFGLIDEGNKVLPPLVALANAEADDRKALLGEIVRRHYAAALKVADHNGTASQLDACFRESYAVAGADTLRKSTSFFLHASRTAGIPLSPHFKQTRGGQGAPGQPKRKVTKRRQSNGATAVAEASTPKVDGYRLDVTLRTGGTMTLTVDVNPISLRGEDRSFFYDIIDKMAGYNEVAATDFPDATAKEELPLEQT
jgi:hypothetical protein